MRKITLVIHQEDDGWWAESPQLPGFSAAAPSLEALRAEASEGVSFHLDDESFEIEEAAPGRRSWTQFFNASIGVAGGVARAASAVLVPGSPSVSGGASQIPAYS